MKRLKSAMDAANRKRSQATQARHGPENRIQTSLSSTDQQLFRGEPTYNMVNVCVYCSFRVVSSGWGTLFALYSLWSACDPPTLRCTWFCGYLQVVTNNLRSFERSELESHSVFFHSNKRAPCSSTYYQLVSLFRGDQ